MSRLTFTLNNMRGRFAPRICVTGGGTPHTYSQLAEKVDQWASILASKSIDVGSVVAIRADYSASAIAALLALLYRGAVAALLPRSGEVRDYLTDAHAECLLEIGRDGAFSWMAAAHKETHPLIESLEMACEAGLVIFTSGSAGRPKAALHSIERFLKKYDRPGRSLRTLAFLLLDHIAGLDTLFYTLCNGGTLVLPDARDPAAVGGTIFSHCVEVLPTSPSFLRMLCLLPSSETREFSRLKVITYGSEPMDAGTLTQLNRRFPSVEIIQKYGTTEVGSPRSVSAGSNSLWMKMKADGAQFRVVDDVLWMRSETAMLGYLNAPSPIDEEGWYCTGDLVEIQGEWLRFKGRMSERINVGGEKVSPEEVEQVLRELDCVRDVVVFGEDHELMGQVVAAHVVLTASSTDRTQAVIEMRRHCHERLGRHKVPVNIEFVPELRPSDRHKMVRKQAPSQNPRTDPARRNDDQIG